VETSEYTKRTLRTVMLTSLVTIVVVGLLVATVIYSGAYNVSAITPHTPLVKGMLHALSENSVARHAGNAVAPPVDSAGLLEGAEHFDEMCVVCHGAPGVAKGEIAEGLNPQAPQLSRYVAGHRTDAQLFWVIRNGIRFTGMPGFQSSHTDEQIWQIVKFVKSMDGMTDAQYEAVIRQVRQANGDTAGMPMHMGMDEHMHMDEH
jgi:mono/diheme cytochrome c family protein